MNKIIKDNFRSKKLLILGGNPETGVLVKKANKLGVFTIVVDPQLNSPAKKYANKSFEIDGFDIPKLVQLGKDEKVDGVLVGVADILVPSYFEVCKALDLPCYASKNIVDALTTKNGFMKAIHKYSISGIPSFNSRDFKDIAYPVMVKPIDSGAGVGMSICMDHKELQLGIDFAIKNSKRGQFLVEKYMDCNDIFAYYTIKDGEIYLSAIADRITSKKQAKKSPVCLAAIYPSRYAREYFNFIHPSVCRMLKGIGVRNGILNIQFFVEGKNFYAYDPGFRLQGEAPDIFINSINGFDHREMLISFALTGSMGIDDLESKNDFFFKGKYACTIWILLNAGSIQRIIGLKELEKDPSVVSIVQRFYEGDKITNSMLGNEKQVFARIYIISKTMDQLFGKIREIKNQLSVIDNNGNDMILDFIDMNYFNS